MAAEIIKVFLHWLPGNGDDKTPGSHCQEINCPAHNSNYIYDF